MTADITRNFADRAKNYAGLQRQQGRIPTDAEENVADEIARRTHEVAFAETICPLGSPDNGFKIGTLNAAGPDFEILGGSFYLGGTRIENRTTINHSAQAQGNWLTMAATDRPAAGSKVFVWLEANEQTVTAVDDHELAEPALRGPDGAARARMAWRVRQKTVAATTCAAAMQEALGADLSAARNPLTGAIEPTGTLQIGFTTTGIDTDLCKPATTPGFLGNRNSTYRAKITEAGRFIWGLDNASHYYRVVVDTATSTLTFLDYPRDEYQRPRAGMTVELLRPDTLLPNQERPGEADGMLARITTSYAERKITIANDAATAAKVSALVSSINTILAALPAGQRYAYARVWTGGGESGAPDMPFVAGTPKVLGSTGLTATFAGALLPLTSWTFSARPDAPEQVLPWAMRTGMPAHAPRRHIAPLGIIDFAAGTVHHCRDQFRPLWRVEDCCTVTVGDGESSFGDFQSIAAAIAALPPEGGCVCLLPGRHHANIALTGRQNIKFTGCEGRTFWNESDATTPLVSLIDCKGIAFTGITMSHSKLCCIMADKTGGTAINPNVGALRVEDCLLIAPNGWALSASHQAGVSLSGCTVTAGPLATRTASDPVQSLAAVILQGEDLLVERCKIAAPLPTGSAEQLRAIGGLHIAGASQRIVVRDNTIDNGAGMGIMLGTVHDVAVTTPSPMGWVIATGVGYTVSSAGCIVITYVPPGGGGSTTVVTKHSDGEIADVRISGNDILNMGSNGIGTYPMILIAEDGTPAEDAILVSRLDIAENRIAACLRYEPPALGPVAATFTPRGGIALAMTSDCLVRNNRIFNNGIVGGYGSCGLGIAYGEDVRVLNNQIEANDSYVARQLVDGPNSAVDIIVAVGGLATIAEGSGAGGITGLDNISGPIGAIRPRTVDRAALQMTGNTVFQPAGRALRVMGLGPIMVTDNHLTGANVSRFVQRGFSEFTKLKTAIDAMAAGTEEQQTLYGLAAIFDLLGGDAVQIINLGIPKDLLWIISAPPKRTPPAPPPTGGSGAAGAGGAGGGSGGTVSTVSTSSPASLLGAFTTANLAALQIPPMFQRGGLVMVANNQIALQRPMPDGPEYSITSILILTLDDLGFADNQFGVDLNRLFVIFDALLVAISLRVNANRAQEAAICWKSVIGFGVNAAIATDNYATREIAVSGGSATIDTPNYIIS